MAPASAAGPHGSFMNTVRYLLSQDLFVLSITSIFIFKQLLPEFVDSGVILSGPLIKPWNNAEGPILFGHLTDVHVNSYEPKCNHKLPAALDHYVNLSIPTLLVTGDLVDNWGDRWWGRFGEQHINDGRLYAEIMSRYIPKFEHVIDIPGNHDEFGLAEFSSPRHFVLNYSHFLSRNAVSRVEDFWVAIAETKSCWFVTLNPFRFPGPHARFDCWARQTREMLDAIEDALARVTRDRPVILACHFPLRFWVNHGVRSSSGRSFRELMTSSNASLYLSGHAHVAETRFFHYDGLLEAVGQDLYQNDGWSVVTVDNGRPIHHSYNVAGPPTAILTHPVPLNQLSYAFPFSERATAVRIVSRNGSLNITVAGAVNGHMMVDRRLSNGMFLYSLPLDVDDGRHKLVFSGDWEHEVEFFVGSSIAHLREPLYPEETLVTSAKFAVVLFVIINFVILLPIDRWQFGPRKRLRLLPRWLRNLLFAVYLAPIYLPISLLEIEGRYGVICWYGFLIDWTAYYDMWGQFIILVYQLGIVTAMAVFASGIAVSRPWHPAFIVDYVVVIACGRWAIRYIEKAIGEAAGILLTALSPLFVFVPLVVYPIIIIWRVKSKEKGD
jgi:predicted MPP superfamily phosphohydrolase